MKLEIEQQRDLALEKIKKSKKIDETDKIFFMNLLSKSAEGTNGLSQEDKLQNVSETVWNLVLLKILDKCENQRMALSWCAVIMSCKWAIVSLGAIACGLLAYLPLIAQVISAMLAK